MAGLYQKSSIFWHVMPCSLVKIHWRFRGWQQAELCVYLLPASCWLLALPALWSQRWKSMFLRNISEHLSVCMASHPRRISDRDEHFLLLTWQEWLQGPHSLLFSGCRELTTSLCLLSKFRICETTSTPPIHLHGVTQCCHYYISRANPKYPLYFCELLVTMYSFAAFA